jgi:hypothetical protein
MSQQDAVRFLHDEGLLVDAIHQHLVQVFGQKGMAYSPVTRMLTQMSWTCREIPKGRPPNFRIDAAIFKVLSRDPTASAHEIAQEARLPTATIFYILTTRIGYTYRRSARRSPLTLSRAARSFGMRATWDTPNAREMKRTQGV